MKNKKLIKYLIIAVVTIVVFVLVGKNAGWIGNKGLIDIYTEKAALRSIYETVSANGKIQPEKQVKISSDVSGEVVELMVKEGDVVKAGQVLANIDPDIYKSDLEKMNATLNNIKANSANSGSRLVQAQAQFENATASFDRNKKLFEQGAISQSDFDLAKSNFEVAKAEVAAAKQNVSASEYSVKSTEASVKEAEKNLTRTVIYSPVDGVVSKLNVEKGERVVGTTQFAGTEMMKIANINEMEVVVQVNENDIMRVKLKDTADVEVDAYIGRKFKGIVTEIATSANTTGTTADQVTNFDVKIRILRSSYFDLVQDKPASYSPFRPGMSATVDIKTKYVSNVISIPIQSVTTRIDSTKFFEQKDKKPSESNQDAQVTNKTAEKAKEVIFVFTNGKVVMREIKTGVQDNTYIQILEGLKLGEMVVSGPYRIVQKYLKDAMEVRKVDKNKIFNKDK